MCTLGGAGEKILIHGRLLMWYEQGRGTGEGGGCEGWRGGERVLGRGEWREEGRAQRRRKGRIERTKEGA